MNDKFKLLTRKHGWMIKGEPWFTPLGKDASVYTEKEINKMERIGGAKFSLVEDVEF